LPLARPPPRPTLFPYTTLFRSRHRGQSLTARTVRAGRDDHVSGRDQSEVDELWALGRSINEDDVVPPGHGLQRLGESRTREVAADRKSTRLNSSHVSISYAVFC